MRKHLILVVCCLTLGISTLTGMRVLDDKDAASPQFSSQIQPLLKKHCYACHGPEKQKNGLRLDHREEALKGGDMGPAIVPGKSEKSPLFRYIAGLEPDMIMPPKGARLTAEEVRLVKKWIDDGAQWPAEAAGKKEPVTWWSMIPLSIPKPPELSLPGKAWAKTAIDSFIWDALAKKQLVPGPEADRRTLIRRLKYDLVGLPPTWHEVETFVKDTDPRAYEKLVDQFLAMPQHGERWARHWLDVVHYGETHGYDKDQPRPHAWPYRDYVIRAFNEDKPYSRFIEEQLAGDVLYPKTRDGIEALGFIAAGPWDLIGHAELPETKIDGKVARHLDRDDMVANTINTFQSLTVHCAQCHNHKFDPIPSEDYYSLQAVFAALDRADKEYDVDPTVSNRRKQLLQQRATTMQTLQELREQQKKLSSPALEQLTRELDALKKQPGNVKPQFGYHSQLSTKPHVEKWVQLDLQKSIEIRSVEIIGCFDHFNDIGAGFGFPRRFRVTASESPDMKNAVVLVDRSAAVQDNPGTFPQVFPCNLKARYIRITAVELSPRQNDYMFALAEVRVLDGSGANRALKASVSALDSIEAPERWARNNLVDGIFPGPIDLKRQHELRKEYQETHARLIPQELKDQIALTENILKRLDTTLKSLTPSLVYAGTVHNGKGNFVGTGKSNGRPRAVFLLQRGNVQKPGKEVGPGSLSALKHLPARFDNCTSDGQRRAALAKWISHRDNPLTWRSIVNRVWLYHFGQGLVDTPNDFGRMGQLPSHPELLDWLANDFRQHGSFKKLHKLIVTSSVYRQSSQPQGETRNKARSIDGSNRLLWKMNRRRLEAEALRDSILLTAGKLDLTMGGPSYQDYIVEKPEHSPHYRYELKDPSETTLHRRAIYRSIVRSQQNPWMATMDCADPSILVDKRNQTASPLQALAMLNDPLLLVMSQQFANRLAHENQPIHTAVRLVLQREPTAEEIRSLSLYVEKYGLAQLGRLLWNLNEFCFVD